MDQRRSWGKAKTSAFSSRSSGYRAEGRDSAETRVRILPSAYGSVDGGSGFVDGRVLVTVVGVDPLVLKQFGGAFHSQVQQEGDTTTTTLLDLEFRALSCSHVGSDPLGHLKVGLKLFLLSTWALAVSRP